MLNNVYNYMNEFPIYPLFILIMIISSNFLAEIFPCRFQELLSNNIYFKHIFGYLTLVFFVSLTIDELGNDLTTIFKNSLYLYLGFIALVRTNKNIFLIILSLLGILYLFSLKRNIINKENNNHNTSKEKIKENKELLNKLEYYQGYINKAIFTLIVIGFILYLGEKKVEYGKEFNYITFLLGKPNCKGESPDVGIIEALQNVISNKR